MDIFIDTIKVIKNILLYIYWHKMHVNFKNNKIVKEPKLT